MTRIDEDIDPPAPPVANPVGGATAAATTNLASAARRRALLKGLGKSAALAGAAVPLSSLAASGQRMRLTKPNDPKAYNCSVSGHMSVLLSQGTSALPDCSGQARAHYAPNSDVFNAKSTDYNLGKYWPNWRKDAAGNAVCFKHSSETTTNACFPTTAFSVAFPGGSTTALGVLCGGGGSADERTWATALLNASTYPLKYPYSPQEVVSLYNDTNKRANALIFFRDYLSSGSAG